MNKRDLFSARENQADFFLVIMLKDSSRFVWGRTRVIFGAWELGLVLLACALGKFPYTPPEHMKGWTGVYELVDTIVEKSASSPSHLFSPEFCSFISLWQDTFYIRNKQALEMMHCYVTCVVYKNIQRDRKSAKELLVQILQEFLSLMYFHHHSHQAESFCLSHS